MLHNLRASFKADLLAKAWLTDATKRVALEKLHNMFAQVGLHAAHCVGPVAQSSVCAHSCRTLQ
jgi:predicted metalloendopeptidase